MYIAHTTAMHCQNDAVAAIIPSMICEADKISDCWCIDGWGHPLTIVTNEKTPGMRGC